MPRETPTLFGLLDTFDAEADTAEAAGRTQEADTQRRDAARIRAWAKEAVTWYLEPGKPNRDYVRSCLACALVQEVGDIKAERIALQLENNAARVGDDEMGQLAAASEIRKAIILRNDDELERFVATA